MGWKEISQRIGELFHLPRAYAFGSNGKWVRVHELLDSDRLAYFYESGTPVCVAMRRPAGEDMYSRLHDFVVFDVDSENVDAAKKAAALVCGALSASEIPYLCTFSGKKGFHVFVFLAEPTDCAVVEAWQTKFMDKYGIMEKATVEFPANVDTQLSTGVGKGKVIKLPFSVHPAVEGAYDTPIADPATFSSVGGLELDAAEALIHAVGVWAVPKKYEVEAPARKKKPQKVQTVRAKKLSGETQEFIINLINAVPCLKDAYDMLKSGTKGGFWERVAICTTLAQCKVPKDEAERFFVENINDDVDNSTGRLSYYVNYCYEKRSWSSCAIFQDEASHTPLCRRPCGRMTPAHDSAVAIKYDETGAEVVCTKCGERAKLRFGRHRDGWRDVDWSCEKCGTTESDAEIFQPDRDEFYRFYGTLKSSPDETLCRRRLRNASIQLYKSMPAWRKLDALKCVKCEAWVGRLCITGDDVRGEDIYSRVEIDMYRGRVGKNHVKQTTNRA